jgi:glycosyltransferase involved in cell wall biosynthesis
MLEQWGARSPVGVVAHTLPEWDPAPAPPRQAPFTIGFAGRLVPEKGIRDLLAAVARLDFPARLLIVGDGPLRSEVQSADLGRATLEVRTGIRGAELPDHYREMDVLVLPSRTTATWAEQFGRVLCEALLCGVPVLGSDSGEIPWVIATTAGGVTFPEGDIGALAAALSKLAADPSQRAALAAQGRLGVEQHFSPSVAARELDALILSALGRRA